MSQTYLLKLELSGLASLGVGLEGRLDPFSQPGGVHPAIDLEAKLAMRKKISRSHQPCKRRIWSEKFGRAEGPRSR